MVVRAIHLSWGVLEFYEGRGFFERLYRTFEVGGGKGVGSEEVSDVILEVCV